MCIDSSVGEHQLRAQKEATSEADHVTATGSVFSESKETRKLTLIAVHLNASHSAGDFVAIGIESPSFPTSIRSSLISLVVSVDVKHPERRRHTN